MGDCVFQVQKGKVIINLVKAEEMSWAVQLSQRGLEQQSDEEDEWQTQTMTHLSPPVPTSLKLFRPVPISPQLQAQLIIMFIMG